MTRKKRKTESVEGKLWRSAFIVNGRGSLQGKYFGTSHGQLVWKLLSLTVYSFPAHDFNPMKELGGLSIILVCSIFLVLLFCIDSGYRPPF